MEGNHHPLNYINGDLCVDEVPIKEIIQSTPTPLYIYSEQNLVFNYQRFFDGAKEAGIEDFQICYAMKANGHKELLKKLQVLGAGADIVSGGELNRAMEAGIDPMKVVFSGVGKTRDEIELALNASLKGIYSFNVESLEELELINELANKKGKRARISLRLNPKVVAKTHKHISTGYKTHKFGILQEDILKAVKQKKYWNSSTLVGLSIHIGSQLTDLGATKKALKNLCETASQIDGLEFLDVGGGLGIDYNYEQSDAIADIKDYMRVVKSQIDKHYKKPIKVVFEPGRIIAARAGIFVTRVLRNKTSENCRFLIVDGGMNDFVRPSLYNAYHEIYPSKEVKDKSKVFSTDIVGPICETADCFGIERKLPELKTDDFIAIADTGAYGQTMSSNYNLRVRPAEVLVTKDAEIELITPQEQYQQLR
jgi:diaminopimelate decarboxylase